MPVDFRCEGPSAPRNRCVRRRRALAAPLPDPERIGGTDPTARRRAPRPASALDQPRIGRPKESTRLRVDGLFRVSRNPMYLGVYSTLLASVLYTLNPVLLLFGAFIVAVHHRIILAEETHLRNAFGKEYAEYCCRVRRYL